MGLQDTNGFKQIKLNIGLGFISKFGSFLLSYLSLPIALNYLGVNYYGVWVVIFSVVSWIYSFDIGIGLGLKNKLNDAFVKKDYKRANQLIATAYIFLFVISLIILAIAITLVYLVDLKSSFNVKNITENQLRDAIIVSIFFTITNFVILLYKQLFSAVNQSGFAGVTTIFYQALVIIFLLIAKYSMLPSLIVVSVIYGGANFLIGLFFTFAFFKKNRELNFNILNFRKKHISSIGGVGIKFFVIQMCMVVIFTSDNIIISKFLGAEAVTSYSLILKTYQAFIMVTYIILTPYWTLFAEAYEKKDFKWIHRTYKKLHLLFLLMIILLLTYNICIDPLLKLWLHTTLNYTDMMIYSFSAFVIIRTFIDLYAVFLNGIGKINLQLILYVFAAIINIPLSIILIKYFHFNSEAVTIATTIAIFPMVIALPIQTYRLLKKGHHGINHCNSCI